MKLKEVKSQDELNSLFIYTKEYITITNKTPVIYIKKIRPNNKFYRLVICNTSKEYKDIILNNNTNNSSKCSKNYECLVIFLDNELWVIENSNKFKYLKKEFSRWKCFSNNKSCYFIAKDLSYLKMKTK